MQLPAFSPFSLIFIFGHEVDIEDSKGNKKKEPLLHREVQCISRTESCRTAHDAQFCSDSHI